MFHWLKQGNGNSTLCPSGHPHTYHRAPSLPLGVEEWSPLSSRATWREEQMGPQGRNKTSREGKGSPRTVGLNFEREKRNERALVRIRILAWERSQELLGSGVPIKTHIREELSDSSSRKFSRLLLRFLEMEHWAKMGSREPMHGSWQENPRISQTLGTWSRLRCTCPRSLSSFTSAGVGLLWQEFAKLR